MSRCTQVLAAVVLSLTAAGAEAQDTLRLAELQAAALRADPRAGQLDLHRSAAELRLAVLGSERLPQFTLNGWASHQSDVPRPTLSLPGTGFPDLPKDRWESTVDVQQLLYDGGHISRERELERARLAESEAGVKTDLYSLRSDVNDAFFAAILFQQRSAEFEALITDLDARLSAVRARVEAGTALRRDAAEVEAERARALLQRDEARANRRAALATLADLVGQPVDTTAVLLLPDETGETVPAGDPDELWRLRLRPEFERFRQSRLRLEREAALAKTQNLPRVSAFGQAGVGLPGLDQFRTSSDVFWRAGIRVDWRAWTWHSAGRTAEALRLQQRILERDEAAFARALARGVIAHREEIQRLTAALTEDRRILELRSAIERQARLQHDEGTIPTAEYVDTRTDVLEARLALQRHRVELAQARARYLTTLGLASFPGAKTP
ncbi:MAG TPA: TolC family protein [Gemmatimonadales bacterium]|nr:TolC family protein [Gemmatimonadales bacterium]